MRPGTDNPGHLAGVAQGVHEQALRTPGAPAVADGERRLDYAALDAAGATVAEALRRAGVRPGQAVAVALPRSWRLVCAMLGILRLGGVVVPLDTLSPPDRRRHILTDSASVALVHDGTAPAELPGGTRALRIGDLLDPEDGATGEPGPPYTGAPVSFLFYTSGTTGRPKGVEVRDAGILRLARPGWIELPEGARYACLANPAFDALSFEVWVPLLTGGCCVVLADEDVQAPHRLAAALLRERVHTLFVTTALFNAVTDTVPDCFAGTRQVLIGGERLNAGVIRRWYHHNATAATRLVNAYGPTETTTFALWHPIPRDFTGDSVPIGRPLPDTGAVLVVPGTERTAAPGEVAELLVSGDALAAGYRNLPEETGRRFTTLPWYDDGHRPHYRTGDLVRVGADGSVDYVGRADRQVKVRGFRIEPGEVERQITAHPAVRQAHVCTRRDGDGGPNELLAYLVADDTLSFDDFDRHLAARLPSYMRPHRVHRLDALPRNANGKVDEAALLARELPPWRRPDGAHRPATAWQREVLALAADVLGVPEPRLDDRWIALGGDSLKALRLRYRIRERWGCELPAPLVLRADFAELADAVAAARGTGGSPYPAPPAPTGRRTAPATAEQQRLWLHQQRSPGSRAYHVGQAFRLDGPVDTAALRRSLRALVARHPALRTAFEATEEGLRQIVGDPYDPWTEPDPEALRDAAAGRAFTDRFFARPFDLARPRMLRACWLPGRDGGVLLLHLHHIAVDGWSMTLLFQDLSTGYAAALTGAEPDTEADAPTPLDHALWQADWFATPAYQDRRDRLVAHYTTSDDGAEPLPAARPQDHPAGHLLHTTLDVVRRAAVDRLCAQLGLTRFQLLLAVFAWTLYGVTGRTRPRIAAPVAGRPLRQFETGVGMFANTVLLPLTVDPGEELREQLTRLGQAAGEVLDGQDVALADVLAARAPGTDSTPFDFLFVLENTDFGALTLPGCTARPLWTAPAEAKCPLTLSVIDHADGLDLLWEYADSHFDATDAEAMAALLRRALDLLAAPEPATPATLVAPHRRSLPQPGRGATAPLTYRTVAEGFARQAARTPDAPAVRDGQRTANYAELDAYAAALAARLRARHRLPADNTPCRIALYFEPSVEHVVCLLALARLNVTIVPLDPSYPPALLRQILAQVDPVCVLLPPGAEAAFAQVDPGGVVRHPVTLSTEPAPAVPPHDGTRPLYTLFTSGSTGVPKGVQVHDRTLCNLFQWQEGAGGLGTPAVTQQFSMLSFDVSFQEIFGTLCQGGLLHLVRPGWRQDPPALLEALESAGVERIFMPYVALQFLAEHGVHLGRYPSRLREVVTAGEQLVCTDAVRRWFAGLPGAKLFNQYGPSETHVVSALCLDGDPMRWPERPAIGHPVTGAVLRVVDEAGLPVPPDCPGELLLGGTMAHRCYLGDPALNDERFTEVPGDGLYYRSGDRARFDRQGLLHYLGRDDQQIKLSGHRLELGHVEAALLRHPAVVAAVVVLDDGKLVACLQLRDADGPLPTADDLSAHLAPLLPGYVRVHRYRRLTALPRTPSGKLDRRAALRATGTDLPRRPATATGATGPEARLAAAFEAVTGSPIGPDQTFFDAGASSLGLMRFHLHCVTELGLRFTVADLFEHVTVRALARFLSGPATTPDEDSRDHHTATDEPIAVIGMAVRLPGARDLAAFWDLVTSGRRGIEHFDAPDGVVGARSQADGLLDFDPGHFGISRHDARLMDPQHRHLLMSCVEALAHAGYGDPAALRVGLVAGAGENTYFQDMLREADPDALPDRFQLAIHHEKDFLATKAAYHLGLTGPAFTTQAACASSLVAVHLAAGLLRQGDADLMLAGGVLIDTGMSAGYHYRPQHIFSTDGHCRPFSDDASGTIGGSGAGVVVLKPLSHARRDGDTVYAVITGSAVNNDGATKLNYSAPSLTGQREVIRAALRRAGRTGADVGYVEAHGTGTRLGDPVEVGALRQAFDVTESGRCALASVKSQIGHLGAAAGVVGLVRAALAVHHAVIPPNVDFHALNPQIGPDPTPFHIPVRAQAWPAGRHRVAAVSSFGIGGTNAHLVLEAAEPTAPAPEPPPCLVLSARSEAALRADAARVADYLTRHPEHYPRVLRHLQAGRPQHPVRAAAVCPDAAAAVTWLRQAAPVTVEPAGPPLPSAGRTPAQLAADWLTGAALTWPAGPAPAPWDFPPPAFDLAAYDFPRAAPETSGTPRRLPESDWLHQPHWARLHRAATTAPRTTRLLVIVTGEPLPAPAVHAFQEVYARVVRVVAADAFARHGQDEYRADPADPESLRLLLDAVADAGADGIDWLHALPLAVTGPVGPKALDRARHACLDTPAALVRAVAARPGTPPVHPWWLSYRARPADGPVRRPELGLLAGAAQVTAQESSLDGHWLDLPGADPADWAAPLAALTAGAGQDTARELALRQGYWWHQVTLPVPATVPAPDLPADGGDHLVLGGTGGIGTAVAAWLLDHTDGRVLLLSRTPRLPDELTGHADRVTLVEADLATTPAPDLAALIAGHTSRLHTVVHAAGVPSGALIATRDATAMRAGTAAKLDGALLMEEVIARHRPRLAVYCSSMSALLGGVGQYDYAAAAGLLDAFAHHRPDDTTATTRVTVDWDVWREAGMALRTSRTDPRHQAHLAVGLTVAEGKRVLARALGAGLPQLLVSVTELEESRVFYTPPATEPAPATAPARPATTPAGLLTDWLCRWLDVDHLDPDAPLYDLGADSLTMLDLISEVKRHFDVELDLASFSHRVSLGEIVSLLAGPVATGAAGSSEVTPEVWQEGTGDDVLCLVHPVGGDIQAYRSLVAALDPRLTVCLIADPALRDPALPDWTLTERARRYHAALLARFPGDPGRLRLAGWSFGGWVALEMAAEAEAAGAPVAALHLVDPPPPGSGPLFQGYDDSQLEAVFAHELGLHPDAAGDAAKGYAERLARRCRANLRALAEHRIRPLTTTPSTLWLAEHPVPGLPSPGTPGEQQARWLPYLPAGTRHQRLGTDHYGVVRPPYAHTIAQALGAPSTRRRPTIGDATP
ncbi:amino acid adenylation domain protein (plasmid) [Streptantibioticus cattleyicolor NRRL 8057 = DSM 46488]|uniref:Amino acid adenylation domain protein n=2 Tax=Streptantibioticus cattleyicolor TaxID=29303 RepID=G8XGR6_STREN|nr:non-ribosomal peptide synthetase [Streptantibioticus cattleyicolor]AEW98743.1 amino acid adenylation domain protein [Streptantibioticus cattleyicolor NRRL 8057 = DSM 46488]